VTRGEPPATNGGPGTTASAEGPSAPRMPVPGTIQTVAGRIDPGDLGVAFPHEHLWCNQAMCTSDGRWRRAHPHGMMILDEFDLIAGELREVYALGGRAVAEATVAGWGRDVARLRDLSRASGVHIVAMGGYYVEPCQPAWARETEDVDLLAEALVREATVGADGTDIRIGLLKSAIGRPVIEGAEERGARAVARAHLRTGLPITTHTSGNIRFEIEGGNIGPALLDLFESEGVDPRSVIVGHTDENADIRVLDALCRRGAFVQFDVIGKQHWMLDATRVSLALQLFERGLGGHLLVASDRARKTELRHYGGPGYGYVLGTFVPMLRTAGLDDAAIHQVLVENPARALQVRRPSFGGAAG
jgi:predicted metal-dependent phosphotriesterase family hydrolase